MAATIVYFGAVWFVVALGADDYYAAFRRALQVPDLAIWSILVAAQVTVWVFVIGPAYRRALDYSDQVRQRRPELLSDVATLFMLSAALVISRYRYIAPVLEFQKAKLTGITLFGVLTALPCLLGLRLVSFAAEAMIVEAKSACSLERFAKLRSDLRWFVGVAGGIVGGAALARGALNNAMVAIDATHSPPVSGIILYVGFCSGIIAVFYVPAHLTFARAARAVITQMVEGTAGTAEEWVELVARREKLEASLGLTATPKALLGELGPLIAPVVGGVVSFFIRIHN